MLAVPDSAVIDSGTRQVVLVDAAKGGSSRARSRSAREAAVRSQVLEGVAAGEKVVVGANFLIDAESNLRAALQAFGRIAGAGGAP